MKRKACVSLLTTIDIIAFGFICFSVVTQTTRQMPCLYIAEKWFENIQHTHTNTYDERIRIIQLLLTKQFQIDTYAIYHCRLCFVMTFSRLSMHIAKCCNCQPARLLFGKVKCTKSKNRHIQINNECYMFNKENILTMVQFREQWIEFVRGFNVEESKLE